jgi:hypothetical protein
LRAAFFDFVDEIRRKRVHVDFQADGECGLRADADAHPAKFGAFDRSMKFERIAPERFVAKSVEAKDFHLATLVMRLRSTRLRFPDCVRFAPGPRLRNKPQQ